MSENSLKQRYVMIKLITVYITYSYLAFVLYMLFHKVYDDEASLVALLLAIPLILFAIITDKHIE